MKRKTGTTAPKTQRRTRDGVPVIYRTAYGEAIKIIFEKFIKLTLHQLSKGENETTLDAGIKRFFHYDTRSVYFAKALRDFTIPGKEWINTSYRHLGYQGSPRRAIKGDTMVVRIDETMPMRVEVEFGDAVFCMPKENWLVISEWVELVA